MFSGFRVWRERTFTGVRLLITAKPFPPHALAMNTSRRSRTTLTVLAAAAASLLMASCRTPLPKSLECTRELRVLQEDRVAAVRSGQVMAFRFRMEGCVAYATGALPAGGTDVQVALVIGGEAKAAFNAVSREKIRVLGAEAWRRLAREVSAALAPDSPHHATLVTAADRELLIHRDALGEPGFYALTRRPPGVTITRRLSSVDLVRRMAVALHALHGPGAAVLLTGYSRNR
jgi:hypothetical protein